MKRTISLALVILLLGLLLCSCEQFASQEEVSRTPVFQPTPQQTAPPVPPTYDTPAPAESPESAAYGIPEWADFTEFPEGNYLADSVFDTSEFLPDYDADLSFLQFQSTFERGVCATADTIYFFVPTGGPWDNQITLLYFYDTASGLTLPLCSKPECTHDDDTCNAVLSSNGGVYGLRIHDGMLYWLAAESDSDNIDLMRMKLDGTDHEILLALSTGTLRDLTVADTWVIHRGYLYIAGELNPATGMNSPFRFFVYAVPINGGEIFPILNQVVECISGNCSISPVGNDLYITVYTWAYGDTSSSVGMETLSCYRWDSKVRKADCLFAAEDETHEALWTGYYSLTTPFPVTGDGLYFSSLKSTGEDRLFHISKLSFQTGEIEQVGDLYQQWLSPMFTEDSIITLDRPYLSQYDYQLNLLFQSETLTFPMGVSALGANRQYAFYVFFDGDQHTIGMIPLQGGDMVVLNAP